MLAQSNPSATTLTKVYTVPGATSTVGSCIAVCNQAGAGGTFRISIRVAGAADNAKQYIAYDNAIGANATVTFVIGITLAATDEVWVYASSATMSFGMFGSEVS